jgi:hypothetical protein
MGRVIQRGELMKHVDVYLHVTLVLKDKKRVHAYMPQYLGFRV